MWFTQLYCFLLLLATFVWGHVPEYITTPSNRIDQYCTMAETCIHDTIKICGKMGEEYKTFLDICDLMEHACDTGVIYMHVDDTKECPAKAKVN